MDPKYIHLRIHTEYSLSDGLVQIQPLIEKCVESHMPAVAVTDQSNVFGVVKFYQEAMNAGIKPIIGADIWLENTKNTKNPFRLTLFCQHHQGYLHLLELISRSYTQGQMHGKAIIKYEWLTELAEGLIILSGAEEG